MIPMVEHDPKAADLAAQIKAEKQLLVEENMALAAFGQVVGAAKDDAKDRLVPYVEPGDTIRPKVDGMDAGAITITKGSATVVVLDTKAHIHWMLRTYPKEVVRVCRPSFWKRFTVTADGEHVRGPNGEVDPPGLAVEYGDPVIRVAPSKDPAVRVALFRRFRTGLNELLPGGDTDD